jgi:predicted CXXCH cytochrome family protein
MNSGFFKLTRSGLVGLLACAILAAGGPASAFHEGGAASCNGCHVMHGTDDGLVVFWGEDPLLRAATASDVCLMCHGGQNGVLGNNPMDPPDERGAGNFVFLLEDNLNDGSDGLTNPIGGEAAGHSIISLDYGLGPDPQWTYAPGGNFPADQLGCTSCHDPHGNGSFRMLNGSGPVQDGLFDFTSPAPLAEGLSITNPLAVEGADQHTAYIRGMSDWCANCHGLYHDESGRDGFEHDSGEPLEPQHLRAYNRYNGTSNPEENFAYSAYLPAVPFESGKNTTTTTEGPQSGARVMCLSCHRAHASSAPHAGRWDFNVDRLDNDGLVSGSWAIPNPYPSDHAQGQLCAKCHYEVSPN